MNSIKTKTRCDNRNDFNLLTGTYISPVYYKAGEVSENTGWIIYENNKIVKELNLRVVKDIDNNFNISGNQELDPHISIGLNNSNTTLRYGKHNGYNEYDDNTIDNAFNGDAAATWNID